MTEQQSNALSMMVPHLNNSPPFGFQFLLFTLLACLVVPAHFVQREQAILMTLTLSSILLASVYLVAYNRRELIVGIVLAILVVASSWWTGILSGMMQVIINDCLYIIFMLYVGHYIMRYLFESQYVSLNMVYAALCFYLLIGLVWAFIYHMIEHVTSGSFTLNGVSGVDELNSRDLFGYFTYYSFVTLSTLGYGDIAPLSRVARSWASLEAIIGQFYLAVVLARLVGLYITAKQPTD